MHPRKLARIAVLPAIGAVLMAAVGCGERDYATANPEVGAQRKQARIDAYGPSGTSNTKGAAASAPAPNQGAQGQARARAQSGR